jgi:ribosome biogenesis GTPase
MSEAVIVRSLSGFYTVRCGAQTLECRAKGVFRNLGVSPLVGDRVEARDIGGGKGIVSAILPRRNAFVRPSVANVDLLVFVASAVTPVTDPFLIDRVAAIAECAECGVAVCINKADLDPGDELAEIYSESGYPVMRTSAADGRGIEQLREVLRGRICAFTGNTGVGKSSLLNALAPGLELNVGEISRKLGRGKHTTRHVELYALGNDTFVADTPGFASFDLELMDPIPKEDLQYAFPEFRPYIGQCRFRDCAHLKEPGCAILQAVNTGSIHPSRHESYARLYELSAQYKDWEKRASGIIGTEKQ